MRPPGKKKNIIIFVLALAFVLAICGTSAAATAKNTTNTYNTNDNQVLPDPTVIRGGTEISNHTTIQEAIDAAQSGDIIRLEYGKTFNLSSTLTIGKSLTFDVWNADRTGPGGTATISGRNGTNYVRIASITSNSLSVTFNNITFVNGRTTTGNGGAINNAYSGSTIILNKCNFTNNRATGFTSTGGAIRTTGALTATDCAFSGNNATVSGGAIYGSGTLTTTNCNFTNNRATGASSTGGAIYNTGTATINSSNFNSNIATSNGGAIYNTGTMNVNNSDFTRNTVNGGTRWTGGGAIYNNAPSGNFNVVNSTFSSNSAPTGGAIICMTTSAVSGSTFTNNTANLDNAGAISFGINNNTPGAGTMLISNNYFTGNTATTNGGAIWSGTNGICIISNNNFVGNIANENGGAIRTWGTTTITSNNLINNTAGTAGGAISIYQGTTTASFNRIINNGSNDINLVNTSAAINANNNWWGINSGPSTGRVTGSGTSTLTTWLQLRITASPTGIPVGGTSNVLATLLYDNTGVYHNPTLGHVPDAILGIFTGIPVNFTGTLGTVNPGSTIFNLGAATTIFTGILPGIGNVSATVDSQTVSTPIYIGSVELFVQQYPWYYDTQLGYADTYNYNTLPVFIVDIGNYGVNDASGVQLQYLIGTGFNYITCNTNGVGTATYNSTTRTITWNIGNMPVDGYAWMMIATRAIQTGDKTTALTNTANLTHVDQYDVPNAYKTASYALNIPTSADIQVEQTVTGTGTSRTITITVTNNGPDTATGVEITDLLPSGLTWVSDTGAGTYDNTTGIWNIGTLTNGQTKTLQITVNITVSTPISNRAVKTNEIEYDWNFNNDAQKVWINTGHNYSVETFVQQYPWYYDTIMGYVDTYYYNTVPIFIVDIGNYGTDDATGVVVQYILGAGYDYVTCNSNGVGTATYNSTTRTITWNIGNMPVDGYAWMMIATRAIQTGDKTTALTNTANLTHVDQYDVPNAYKTASYALNIPTSADIQVEQTVTGTGTSRTITITVTNNGPDTATGVEITDLLPSGLTWVSDTGAGTYDNTTGIWNIGTLTNGQTKTLQITVNITGTGVMTNRAVKTNVTEYDWNFNNDSQQRFIYG